MKFADLRLAEPIRRAVAAEGYSDATPIQAQTIPHVLEGRDVLGTAQTGTGKTAAFALPMLHRLAEAAESKSSQSNGKKPNARQPRPRCLVLCPTRELAVQIADSFATYGKHLPVTGTTIYGGVNQHAQVKALRRGVDVIVATPGRLQDLMQHGHVDLAGIETLVLDEADRMLDMGFINDIKRITAELPRQRQTLLFSATLSPEIRKLASRLQEQPATVELAPKTATVDAIDQSVYFVPHKRKADLLTHLLEESGITPALVFTRTKHGADRVVKKLRQSNVSAEAIHGNKTQNARQKALKNFTVGRTNVLVATDIAARGIDVDGISHVINYDLTHEPETYVHRIGRTARAGASGTAVSFCDHDERGNLLAIQRLIRQNIAVRSDGPSYTASEKSMNMKAAPHASGASASRNRRSTTRRSNAKTQGGDGPDRGRRRSQRSGPQPKRGHGQSARGSR